MAPSKCVKVVGSGMPSSVQIFLVRFFFIGEMAVSQTKSEPSEASCSTCNVSSFQFHVSLIVHLVDASVFSVFCLKASLIYVSWWRRYGLYDTPIEISAEMHSTLILPHLSIFQKAS